jgi:hypothetical protein
MSIHIKSTKFKIGPLSLGTKLKNSINIFPFTAIIEEKHAVARTKFNGVVLKMHERLVKVISQDEVYVAKHADRDCYFCQRFHGYLKRENINKDPYVSKILMWTP